MTTPRRRDAASTRLLLLDAARRRFARDGYAATTVRDIATEAGVNVALINRYFASKEGLFEACLGGAVDELGRTVTPEASLDEAPARLARRLARNQPDQLVLLLRSSGDERADEIRFGVLASAAERLAGAAGWRPGGDDDRLLRAQLVIAAALGTALLRTTGRLGPLAGATEDDLTGPLRDLIDGLLRCRETPDGSAP